LHCTWLASHRWLTPMGHGHAYDDGDSIGLGTSALASPTIVQKKKGTS
jgi:hypothetical protein